MPSKAIHQAHNPSQKKQHSVRSVSSTKQGMVKEMGGAGEVHRYQKFNQ